MQKDEVTFRQSAALEIASIVSLTQDLTRFAAAKAVPAEVQNVLAIVLEEILTNALKYGYPDGRRGQVEIEAVASPASIQLTIMDDGDPFDPLQARAPKLDCSLEEREIGGLGLHLVRSLTDSLNYARHNGRNVLTVAKGF